MPPFRFRDDDSSTGTTIASVLLGAIAGFAVGMYVAQRVGGFSGLTEGLTARFRRKGTEEGHLAGREDLPVAQFDEIEEEIEDEDEAEIGATNADDPDFNGMDDVDEGGGVPLLEERVLEAFNNDPILAERAIDIGALATGSGVIELAGWVDSDDEAEHAMTIARGVPGVETVVNRLLVDDEEQQLDDTVRRFNEGDPALNQAHWEGQQVGTGKRRQGTSGETDRHADPKPVLEEHWLSKREAVRNSADDIDEISAERRAKRGKGAKTARADEAEPPA
jgi:hypothetical protein